MSFEKVFSGEQPYYLHLGDCLEFLKILSDNSIDAVVTDPPAGIGFMNKDWDKDKGGRAQWVAWLSEIMAEVVRVLKPGGHALVWSLPRTSHWTALALEESGFEIRDSVLHIFGSGFPKSLNLGNGQGTALKPAHETWWLCRKPIEKGLTIAQNCQKWGTGGLDIDGCRVEIDKQKESDKRILTGDNNVSNGKHYKDSAVTNFPDGNGHSMYKEQGRFPANVIHDGSECVMAVFPDTKSGEIKPLLRDKKNGVCYGVHKLANINHFQKSEGSAARFFYCAKASTSERNKGLDDSKNVHPTVKPLSLISYLIKLISREGQTVLDPFTGSGTTGLACMNLNRRFIGCELNPDYHAIAKNRIEQALKEPKQEELFNDSMA